MSEITVIVHTYNSAAKLPRLLSSISWCQKIIAVDMESSDETRSLLAASGAQICDLTRQPWSDFLRNPFLESPESEWVLVLDSDEYLDDRAKEQITKLIASAKADEVAFALPRYNWCFGRILEGSRWYPDRQVRLFRKGSIRYPREHHRPPTLTNPESKIVQPELEDAPHIHHDHYASIREFIERQNRYALTDHYQGAVDWSDYNRKAIECVIESKATKSSEERAMELILAWDHISRALLHWEVQGRISEIPEHFGWAFGAYSTERETLPPLTDNRLRARITRFLRRIK